MGYYEAIEAAGVKIKEYKEFGSYQGDWFAILEDNTVVHGGYGSCSGCDSFQGEFGWDDNIKEKQSNGKYYRNNYINEDDELSEEQANIENQAYNTKLCKFGQSYIVSPETLSEITERYKKKTIEEYAWEDDREIYHWLLEKCKEYGVGEI